VEKSDHRGQKVIEIHEVVHIVDSGGFLNRECVYFASVKVLSNNGEKEANTVKGHHHCGKRNTELPKSRENHVKIANFGQILHQTQLAQ